MKITNQLLQEIFEKNHCNLCGFASSKIHHDSDAQDIALEAFGRLWAQQSSFESEEHMRRYLYVIVRNLCIDYIKRRKSEHYTEALLTLAEEPAIYNKITSHEQLKWLDEQIEKLPNREKQVMKLCLQNLDNQTIAEQLSMQESYVRTVKARLVQRLREARKDT